jgi:hypothetical protein
VRSFWFVIISSSVRLFRSCADRSADALVEEGHGKEDGRHEHATTCQIDVRLRQAVFDRLYEGKDRRSDHETEKTDRLISESLKDLSHVVLLG